MKFELYNNYAIISNFDLAYVVVPHELVSDIDIILESLKIERNYFVDYHVSTTGDIFLELGVISDFNWHLKKDLKVIFKHFKIPKMFISRIAKLMLLNDMKYIFEQFIYLPNKIAI